MEEKVKTKFAELAIVEIQPNPYQIREVVEEDEEFQEFVKSIHEKGVIQPIIVRMVDGKPQVVAGTRRLVASRSAGKDTIPAIIQEISDEEAILWSIAENLHRTEPSLLEQAGIFKRLADDFYGGNLNRVAEQIGKSRSYVADRLMILDLPIKIQQMSAQLNISQLKALNKIEDSQKQIQIAEEALKNNLSAEQIALEIQATTDQKPKPPLGPPSAEERVDTIQKQFLKLYVNLKSLNQSIEAEKKAEQKDPDIKQDNRLIDAIEANPYFRKNLQALVAQLDLLTNNLADED